MIVILKVTPQTRAQSSARLVFIHATNTGLYSDVDNKGQLRLCYFWQLLFHVHCL